MRVKKINKVVSLLLCMAMLITPMMSFAAGSSAVDSVGSAITDIDSADPTGKDTTQTQKSEYNEYSNAGDNTVNVYATKGSVFSIKIPKTVILDGQSKSGQYQVAVTGDFAGQEIISVIPDASFTLSQAGKDDVTATVVQDKTEWSYDETAINATGTITANDVSAGMWNGSFTFNINVSDSPVVNTFELYYYNGGLANTYQYEEGMTWGEWVDSEYNIDGHKVLPELFNSIVSSGGTTDGGKCISTVSNDGVDISWLYTGAVKSTDQITETQYYWVNYWD